MLQKRCHFKVLLHLNDLIPQYLINRAALEINLRLLFILALQILIYPGYFFELEWRFLELSHQFTDFCDLRQMKMLQVLLIPFEFRKEINIILQPEKHFREVRDTRYSRLLIGPVLLIHILRKGLTIENFLQFRKILVCADRCLPDAASV